MKLTGGYVTSEGGEMRLEFTGVPGDAMPVKDFLVPQLNAAREREVDRALAIANQSPSFEHEFCTVEVIDFGCFSD